MSATRGRDAREGNFRNTITLAGNGQTKKLDVGQ